MQFFVLRMSTGEYLTKVRIISRRILRQYLFRPFFDSYLLDSFESALRYHRVEKW